MRNYGLILLLLIFNSCNYFTIKKETKQAVARVNNTFLYKEDIKEIVASVNNKQDSILVTTNYINNWIKQQLLLSKAEINLENETDKFEELVKKYRQDLYINSYKEAVVQEYLNTDISNDDVQKFYSENSQNFKLNEELLKLKFIKIGKDVYDKKEIIKLFKSVKKEDLDSLVSKEMSLKLHHLNDSVWVKYSDLVFKIPLLKTIDKSQLLKKGTFIQKEDSLSLYLVTVNEVLGRSEVAPISYISPTIKQMILHQRKLLLIRNIEETLIEDASKKQQFEIY